MANKAYLNAIWDEGDKREIFQWLCKLDEENDRLRAELRKHGIPTPT